MSWNECYAYRWLKRSQALPNGINYDEQLKKKKKSNISESGLLKLVSQLKKTKKTQVNPQNKKNNLDCLK